MKRTVSALIAAVAVVTLALLGSCGGQNECEKACDKIKSCVSNLKCDQTEPLAKAACEQMKAALGAAGNCSGECTSEAEATAKEFNGCTLDPATCGCATQGG